jgi:outer membrane protein OmpA-like peptidoglycan-associated protein
MKNKISIHSLFLLLALFVSTACFAQSDDLVLADQYYAKFSFGKAIPLYEKVIEHDANNLKVKIKLADCYRRNNKYQEAERWYEQIVADTSSSSQQQLLYAQVLLNLNKRDKATEQMKKYIQRNPSDITALEQLNAIETNADFFRDKNLYIVKRLLINTPSPDMCAIPYKDGIVFSSSRDGGKTKEQDWTSRPYLSLWFSKGKQMTFDTPKIFEMADQTKFNDGPVCFNADATEMFITRNNEENGKIVKDKKRVVRLKILIAKFINGKFDQFKDFEYNGKEYSCAHPCLSMDGGKLYFASDMPGSVGGMDLWVCSRNATGWDAPVNLGIDVNTINNEVFPFVDTDGKLFFSSNGRVGVGGLDIYCATSKEGKFGEVKNMEVPINSTFDDFSYVFDKKNECGYFSSNRDAKNENDDLYTFKLAEEPPVFDLKGHVYLEEDKTMLVGQVVELMNLRTNEVSETATDKDGNYHFKLEANTDYKVSAFREKCADNFSKKSTKGLKRSTTLIADFGFFCEGDVIKIDNIYYDLAKWNIRPDAAKELDKLVVILKKYPKMTIELGSHTDCRATEKYNMDLSQKRAKSAVDYIIKNGIESSRMKAKGYGESVLVNKCECEGTRLVPCTEQEHQQNRRTEFKVLTVK